jgi:hypothetical protein
MTPGREAGPWHRGPQTATAEPRARITGAHRIRFLRARFPSIAEAVSRAASPGRESAVTYSSLPDRTLDKHELQRLVDDLASRPELWRERIAFSHEERYYASLHRDELRPLDAPAARLRQTVTGVQVLSPVT